MCKYTCLDCVNYKPQETKVVGRKLECDGMISVPVYGEIPHHCGKHPRYFKKWWKKNGPKKREDCVQPKCIELHEHLKTLDSIIGLSKEILEGIKEKKKNG